MEETEEILNSFTCRICSNSSLNKFYSVKEMQLGFRDEFKYCQCSACGCLQLVNPPADISKYYPTDYYSFNRPKRKVIKEKLNSFRDRYSFGTKSIIGKILYKKYGEPVYIIWLKTLGVNLNSRIADIGCGYGKFLYRMGNMGFKNLTGIDPYIKEDIAYINGVKVLKKSLFELKEKYDLVMMHHSLEHMEDQEKVLEKISSLINKGGKLFIRLPVIGFPWEKYKQNWYSLDAPRHFFLHSHKSIELLLNKHGFKIYKTIYDSESIQLWGSEQYQKDISLYDERSYSVNPSRSIFSQNEMDEFENLTKKLNEQGNAGQAGFFAEKI